MRKLHRLLSKIRCLGASEVLLLALSSSNGGPRNSLWNTARRSLGPPSSPQTIRCCARPPFSASCPRAQGRMSARGGTRPAPEEGSRPHDPPSASAAAVPDAPRETVLGNCARCGSSEKLKFCSRCHTVRYCGPACQRADVSAGSGGYGRGVRRGRRGIRNFSSEQPSFSLFSVACLDMFRGPVMRGFG